MDRALQGNCFSSLKLTYRTGTSQTEQGRELTGFTYLKAPSDERRRKLDSDQKRKQRDSTSIEGLQMCEGEKEWGERGRGVI